MAPSTVLVVENDPTTRGVMDGFLRRAGHRVLSESEGEWALGVAEAESVDLVILDQRLCDLSGVDVLRRLRDGARTRELPVILLGGAYAEPPPALDDLGPVTFLAKPLDLGPLAAAVGEALQTRTPSGGVPIPDRARGPIPARGDLSRLSFGRLVGRLARDEAGGALLVERSAAKKVVFFEQGRPVFVQSNLLAESLGQVLLHERLLTEADLEQALLHNRRSGRPLGDVVVDRDLMTEHQLAFALERQMEQKLFDLFGWVDGSFRYRAEARHSGPRITLPLGPVGLVFEGAARTMSVEAIEAELSAERHRAATPVDVDRVRDAVLALEPAAAGLLDRLDGTTPLDAVVRDPELGRPAALALVYALVVTGQVVLQAPHRPERVAGRSDPVQARIDAEMRRIGRAHRRSAAATERSSRARPIPLSEAEALSAKIAAAARALEGREFPDLLGVSMEADAATLRRAYRAASARLDPELLLSGWDAPDLLQRAEANHLQVIRAFQVLSDPPSRELHAAWRADPESHLLPALRAADRIAAGDRELEAGRFRAAGELFRAAAELDPAQPYAAAAAAYADFRAGDDPKVALQALRAARTQAPDDPECMVLEARVLEAGGEDGAAAEVYRAAVAVDPDCLEAQRALARIHPDDRAGVVAKVTRSAKALLGRSSESGHRPS